MTIKYMGKSYPLSFDRLIGDLEFFKGDGDLAPMLEAMSELLTAKMEEGELKYGPYNPLTDTRTLMDESMNEDLDSINYNMMDIQKLVLKHPTDLSVLDFVEEIRCLVHCKVILFQHSRRIANKIKVYE